ncbi:hypothetical protein SLEP1_g2422 [Rubroshorea leprosula]|uniref:Uncharacterized protein n=1 Tax=Rubroshorea leprosula TaxID=152421 RepID=A0AAV5HLJ3_9ROSI|nr:hypothetical protein SLEP1_g2422 [Rubroshorea leprosula]
MATNINQNHSTKFHSMKISILNYVVIIPLATPNPS